MKRLIACAMTVCLIGVVNVRPADDEKLIAKDAKVYIAPMEGFETYLAAAIMKKEVPVSIVGNRDLADFQVTSTSSSPR